MLRTKDALAQDNVGIVSAGVAFYVFLGLFPLLAAIISLYSLLSSPSDVIEFLNQMEGVLPQESLSLVGEQIERLTNRDSKTGLFFIISILGALWSGSKAVKGFIVALNIAYNVGDGRKFIKKNVLALTVCLAGVIGLVVTIFLIAILPILLSYFPMRDSLATLFSWLRWPLLLLGVITAMSLLYRWLPDKANVRWRWITPGSAISSFLWLGMSVAFSYYVSNFASYNKTYGSLGAIVILLMWLYLSSYLFLMGAEFDSEMEALAGLSTSDSSSRIGSSSRE